MIDTLFTNAKVLLPSGEVQEKTAVAVSGGRISDILKEDAVEKLQHGTIKDHIDCHNRLLTPGLIDCHTHLVYAGDRAFEFELKTMGKTYLEIAQSGGGINNTVQATRAASEEVLLNASKKRLLAMLAQGVTTIEIKSGYGLSLNDEIKMLKVANQLGEGFPVRICPTFLGAHTIPLEYKENADDYVELLCNSMLPEIKRQNLAVMVDIFSESIAFNLAQTKKILGTAKALGFQIKCHAEQLTNLGASQYAASLNALSCEHLEYSEEKDIQAMADNNTVAVLLPGAFYFLKEKQKPPIEGFRRHGVKMAIATDCNPGSSPTTNLPLVMNMACVLFGLTVKEAWLSVTKHAAQALGLEGECGQISKGLSADLVLWETESLADICYQFGFPFVNKVMYRGQWR